MAEPTDLHIQICDDLLQCQKYAALYPESHPRLRSYLESIQKDLVEHQSLHGEPFCLTASEVLEFHEIEEFHFSRGERELSALLENRLIEKLTLSPSVTEDEILQFCLLLKEDGKKQAPAEKVMIELQELNNIGFLFYELSDYSTVVPLMTGTEGDDASQNFADLLQGLDSEIKARLHSHLSTSDVQVRIQNLVQRLDSSTRVKSSERNLPLIREILNSAIQASHGAGRSSAEAILDEFRSALNFFEQNAESLAKSAGLARAEIQGALPIRDVASYSSVSNDFTKQVKKLQRDKSMLRAVFQNRSSEEITTQQPRQSIENTPEKASRREEPASDNWVEELLARIYDPSEIIASLGASSDLPGLLQSFYELSEGVSEDDELEGLQPDLQLELEQCCADRLNCQGAMELTSRYVANCDSKAARRIILDTLNSLSTELEVRLVLESSIAPILSEDDLRWVFHSLNEMRGKNAIALLGSLTKSKNEKLVDLAFEKLLEMAQDPALLTEWAEDDSYSMLSKRALDTLIRQVGPHRIGKAFRHFFKRSKPRQAIDFLYHIPKDVEDAVLIVISAFDHGGPALRHKALELLRKFPSPIVVENLIEVIKLNNYRDDMDKGEVEAAFESLLELSNARVNKFFNEVAHKKKGWIRFAFRAEIRKVFLELKR